MTSTTPKLLEPGQSIFWEGRALLLSHVATVALTLMQKFSGQVYVFWSVVIVTSPQVSSPVNISFDYLIIIPVTTVALETLR